MKKLFILFSIFSFLLLSVPAAASFSYNRHGVGLRFSGEGTAGASTPGGFFPDFRLRGQFNYAAHPGWTAGAVYSIDQLATSTGHYARDAFLLVEGPQGRIEAGITNSIATKLGLGLPDVGQLNVNEYNFIYGAMNLDRPMISNPVIDSARYSLRANFATVPTKPFQLGVSIVPWDPNFKYSSDFGLRFRSPHGKTKMAASFGTSFIDSPKGLVADLYAPSLTADSRNQISAGVNVQYRSWNWGLTARGIYDKNPVGPRSDGLQTGTGISYEFLNYSASVSYMLSEVGVWHRESVTHHTGILSLRYKIDRYFSIWASGGMVKTPDKDQPFAAGGLHVRF